MLEFNDQYPVEQTKGSFLHICGKSGKFSCAHSKENPVLINFLNLSTISCPKLSKETNFHFQFVPDSLNLQYL